eukprot:21085-Heterococcus_DN1.PRE.3
MVFKLIACLLASTVQLLAETTATCVARFQADAYMAMIENASKHSGIEVWSQRLSALFHAAMSAVVEEAEQVPCAFMSSTSYEQYKWSTSCVRVAVAAHELYTLTSTLHSRESIASSTWPTAAHNNAHAQQCSCSQISGCTNDVTGTLAYIAVGTQSSVNYVVRLSSVHTYTKHHVSMLKLVDHCFIMACAKQKCVVLQQCHKAGIHCHKQRVWPCIVYEVTATAVLLSDILVSKQNHRQLLLALDLLPDGALHLRSLQPHVVLRYFSCACVRVYTATAA